MPAVFTPQRELQEIAHRRAGEDPGDPSAFGARHYYPRGRNKGQAPLYVGRVHVTMPAGGGQVAFELLDGTYAGAGIVATDEIFVEAEDLAVAGAWTVGTVTDPSADVDPLDPPANIDVVVIDGAQASVGSHTTQVPNRTRGRVDTIVEASISEAIQRETNNRRNRGNTGFSRSSDNLRQLTFQGVVTGQFIIGSTVTGGTSGAVGTIVGLGPGINQGLGPDSYGFFITVDMGIHNPSDAPLVEFDDTTPEVVTTSTGGSGTLKLGDIGERSTGILFRAQGNPAYVSGKGTILFATSGFLEFENNANIVFPNPNVDFQNGIFVGDSVQFDDAPIAGQTVNILGITGGNADPTKHDAIIVDPAHGASGGFSQSPVNIFYDVNAPEELVATQLEFDATSPSFALISIADGRTWSGIGISKGDVLRSKNAGNPANEGIDFRIADFFTTNRPDDRGFLPGSLSTAFTGLDTMDIYRIAKVPPGNRS